MSQATTWSVPLSGPATPTTMATRMDDSLDALLSSHSGSARPAYAVGGTVWISTATAGKLKRYLFDGTNDRLIETIDIATGAITYEGGTMAGAVNYAGFALQNPLISGIPGGALLQGFLYGLTLSNNATDATNDIDIAVGAAASDGATPYFMTLASALTKRLDAAWAVGSGNGGWLDGASMPNGTGHAFLMQRSDTGVVDVGFSASTSPTLPTNYDRKRRIGSIIRSGATILAFRQFGNRFMLASAVAARSSTAAFADALLTVTTPAGIRTRPILTDIMSVNTSSSAQNSFGDGDGSAVLFIAQTVTNSGADTVTFDQVYTNTSSQIRYLCQISSGTIVNHTLSCVGWWDDRGINA